MQLAYACLVSAEARAAGNGRRSSGSPFGISEIRAISVRRCLLFLLRDALLTNQQCLTSLACRVPLRETCRMNIADKQEDQEVEEGRHKR